MTSKSTGRDRVICGEVLLDAGVAEVWDAWTTGDGIRTFFAPDCHVDLRVDGLYEIFFAPDAPEGERGADGMRLMVIEPGKSGEARSVDIKAHSATFFPPSLATFLLRGVVE